MSTEPKFKIKFYFYHPEFTDEEAVTLSLFGIMQKHPEIKDIYNYGFSHLGERFPKLPSYTAFVQRINRFECLFPVPADDTVKDSAVKHPDILQKIRLINSLPLITAGSEISSSARAAQGFAGKGYCSSEGIYCCGVRLHVLAAGRHGSLRCPDVLMSDIQAAMT